MRVPPAGRSAKNGGGGKHGKDTPSFRRVGGETRGTHGAVPMAIPTADVARCPRIPRDISQGDYQKVHLDRARPEPSQDPPELSRAMGVTLNRFPADQVVEPVRR